jgi:hypothetical protein
MFKNPFSFPDVFQAHGKLRILLPQFQHLVVFPL